MDQLQLLHQQLLKKVSDAAQQFCVIRRMQDSSKQDSPYMLFNLNCIALIPIQKFSTESILTVILDL